MYTQHYSKNDPAPMYYHACGQPVELHTHTTGYSSWDLTVVNGKAVRNCPRCGKRIWRENLIHPDDRPKLTDAEELERHKDHLENEDRRYAAQRGVL